MTISYELVVPGTAIAGTAVDISGLDPEAIKTLAFKKDTTTCRSSSKSPTRT